MFCINVIINNVFCDCSVVIATGFFVEGLEDAWPRFCYFLHTHGHSKSIIFEHG